jgi:hypothetical protein
VTGAWQGIDYNVVPGKLGTFETVTWMLAEGSRRGYQSRPCSRPIDAIEPIDEPRDLLEALMKRLGLGSASSSFSS